MHELPEYTGRCRAPEIPSIHPNGTYYFSSVAGMHRGWLQGPANADFDLYLQKWNGFFWVTVARSESVTSEEQIAYNGTPGTTAGASTRSAAAARTRSGCSDRDMERRGDACVAPTQPMFHRCRL